MDELDAIRARKMENLQRMAEASAEPVEVSDETFEDIVSEGGLVVVDCWAEWCGPCRMLSPVVDQLAEEYAGKVVFARLNVDENSVTAAKFGIMSIPTLLIFKDSRLVDTIVGAVPKSHIKAVLKRHI